MITERTADECLRNWIEFSGYNQSDIAEILEVSRQAVSKWAKLTLVPSTRHARELDELSQGAIPATLWPRRRPPPPKTTGAGVIQKAAASYGGSITALAIDKGIPQRALARWGSGQNAPQRKHIARLNKALDVNLTAEDFQVSA
jgi:ribosome-binding protein aMBF1 (putative translation factor)